MQNDIKKAIEDIYINGNTELFISKCRDTVDFLDELLEKIKTKSENVEKFFDSNEPSSEIRNVVNRCSFSEGEIEYVSLLQINKIVKYFYLQDEFSIANPDPDGMDSYLAGFRNEPYSKVLLPSRWIFYRFFYIILHKILPRYIITLLLNRVDPMYQQVLYY